MIERKLRFASAFIFKRDLNSFTKILKERKLTDSKQSLAGADYFQLLNARNEESIRSVLIAIPNGNASDPLKKTLEARYGALQYFHSFEWKLKKHAVMVEFKSQKAMNEFMKSVTTSSTSTEKDSDNQCSTPSRCRVVFAPKEHLKAQKQVYHATTELTQQQAMQKLLSAKSVSEQIKLLHQQQMLGEVGIRLRFFVCSLIADAIGGLFPHARCFPFGSSVNGFGHSSSDLDSTLVLDCSEPNSKSDFHFFSKTFKISDRLYTQRTLETVGDWLNAFMPFCHHMVKILNARVPILKFDYRIGEFNVDLCLNNLTGVGMSQLLWTFQCLDDRVAPLVFSIRQWAKTAGITQSGAGQFISNFHLIVMVIFYLQCSNILPSIEQLKKLASPADKYEIDGLDCSLVTDLKKVENFSKNQANLETLFHGFFEFYSKFDFTKDSISILLGTPMPKIDFSPLYIHNPIERDLNAAKNVGVAQLENLVKGCNSALWALDGNEKGSEKSRTSAPRTLDDQEKRPEKGRTSAPRALEESEKRPEKGRTSAPRTLNESEKRSEEPWGLAKLLDVEIMKYSPTLKKTNFDVKSLFDDENQENPNLKKVLSQ